MLRIRGRHLDSVGKVLFVGAAGKTDNIGVVPSAQTSSSVDVKVPQLANNGKLVLLDPAGHSSRPSPRASASCATPVRGSPQGRVAGPRHDHGRVRRMRGDHIHTGLDIAIASGTPIKAAAAGTVILLGWQGGYGNFTCIRHASLVTCYAHQSSYEPPGRLCAPGPDDRPRRVHRQLLGPAPAFRGPQGPRGLVLSDGPGGLPPAPVTHTSQRHVHAVHDGRDGRRRRRDRRSLAGWRPAATGGSHRAGCARSRSPCSAPRSWPRACCWAAAAAELDYGASREAGSAAAVDD